jgi:uncharacterized membrane protein
MGFVKNDAEGIIIVVFLAVVFAWMFAFILNLYIIGIAITVLSIVVLFIFQSLRFLVRDKTNEQTPKP